MALSTLIIVYAGVTGALASGSGYRGLIGAESVVFAASGMTCPLTAVVRYSGGTPAISDT